MAESVTASVRLRLPEGASPFRALHLRIPHWGMEEHHRRASDPRSIPRWDICVPGSVDCRFPDYRSIEVQALDCRDGGCWCSGVGHADMDEEPSRTADFRGKFMNSLISFFAIRIFYKESYVFVTLQDYSFSILIFGVSRKNFYYPHNNLVSK